VFLFNASKIGIISLKETKEHYAQRTKNKDTFVVELRLL